MNRYIPEGHEQRAGTAGQTSALCSCTEGPGVHQQSFAFSALQHAPTTKGVVDGLGQGVKLRIQSKRKRIKLAIIFSQRPRFMCVKVNHRLRLIRSSICNSDCSWTQQLQQRLGPSFWSQLLFSHKDSSMLTRLCLGTVI